MSIDFKKLNDNWYAGLTPEERARVDAHRAQEARWNETAEDIPAVFEQIEWKKPAPPSLPTLVRRPSMMRPQPQPKPPAQRESEETEIVRTWEKPVTLRIEDREGSDGVRREILRFIGAVTGYEAYELTEDLCASLVDPAERAQRPRWYICGGTPGSYHGCSVAHDDVEVYLRKHRPQLFPDQAPAPGLR